MPGSNTAPQNTPAAPPLAVYIHWPFCKKKCPYCDFNSHVRNAVDYDSWQNALLLELRYWHARLPDHQVTSIFFGGGTPSLMPPSIVAALLNEAARLWTFAHTVEITLEANPTSVEAANFKALRSAGINRVSLGVQSLRPPSLQFLGREHSVTEALDAVALAAQLFPRYSFDLIYALPNQTLHDWEAELTQALTYARGHVSLYQLTIEPNTAFHHAYHVGKQFALPEDSLAAALYEATQVIMESAGLPAYEISNHARPGEASRHNTSYWRSEAYIGIGPGAHGRVNIGAQRLATHTIKSPERWLEHTLQHRHGIEEALPLSTAEHAEEAMLMGLRLTQEGCKLTALPPAVRGYLETLWANGRVQRLMGHGLLYENNGALIATRRGQLVLNRITAELLAQ